ncbi:RICIN domain-containing protein [Streptomyces sp. NBC_01498]|uniref:RICIN domain-containing protein n=1 Tax=Streptomyces sp. NBC_01498 TaxID=2975870 RepID=UPI002E7C1246|nr:RICIN domain-containing protein [Streptomyces sp. NBC_01498]WTL23365.1 RICIN domain-containing protein [Streptomyces sp. NBC_01498]
MRTSRFTGFTRFTGFVSRAVAVAAAALMSLPQSAAVAESPTAVSRAVPPASAPAAENPGIRYTTSFRNAAVYEVRAAVGGKCLDIRGGGRPQAGAVIQTFDCKNELHQRFHFQSLGNGTFTIGAFGVYCLGAQGGGPTPGAPVVLTTGSGCSTFTWNNRGTSANPDRWEFVEVTTGQCVRDTGRRSQAVLGACGGTAGPGPEAWDPRFKEYFNYDQF